MVDFYNKPQRCNACPQHQQLSCQVEKDSETTLGFDELDRGRFRLFGIFSSSRCPSPAFTRVMHTLLTLPRHGSWSGLTKAVNQHQSQEIEAQWWKGLTWYRTTITN
ncbi:hypothetical protein HYE67_003313 [Fusarium culmorum]|uniref:Uncharacterized protein n=1 Tax=Fusarium culmorum TaxID=5516 RepID=A0A2T4GMP7_FUSCU|nr:hypothetical protein FCULG_00000444 [Fusarium culmorum]QPC61082.1 hypothetical protein HYE67_003313 [Fusarium culmorum]